MVVEHTEKTRLEIRAIKILPDLWELGHEFYIIGIVSSQATLFMLWVFDFMQARARYRFGSETRAGGSWRTGTKLSWAWRLGPSTFHTPLFPICTPLCIFLYFCIFSHIFYVYWLYYFFLNIKKSQKYFLNFLHFYFIFLSYFLHKILII